MPVEELHRAGPRGVAPRRRGVDPGRRGGGARVSLVVSAVQAATQISDSTVSHLPRLAVVTALLVATGPWMGVADRLLSRRAPSPSRRDRARPCPEGTAQAPHARRCRDPRAVRDLARLGVGVRAGRARPRGERAVSCGERATSSFSGTRSEKPRSRSRGTETKSRSEISWSFAACGLAAVSADRGDP